MDKLKLAIFNEIRENFTIHSTKTYDELDELIFYTGTFRLSYTGFLILKKIFTAYSFPVNSELKAKHQMGMAKLEYPYFTTAVRLVLFSEMDAMVINLYGSVESFLENYYNDGRDK